MFKVVRMPMFEADTGANGGGGDPASSNGGGESFFPATPGWGLPASQPAAEPQQGNPFIPAPAAAPAQPVIPNPAPVVPAPAPTFEPQTVEISGRRIVVTDPAMLEAIQAVQGDYTSLQSRLTKDGQRMRELEVANQTFQQSLQAFQQQQPPAQPQQPQMTPEQLAAQSAEFLEKFYENPTAAIAEQAQQIAERMFNERVNPVIEPITQERRMNEQVQSLSRAFPDAQEMMAPMNELLNESPELLQQVREGRLNLDTVYYMAKGKTAQTAAAAPAPAPAAAPTIDQLLSDPNILQQVLARPEVQQQVISQYAQGKFQTNQQTPPVMGSTTGGQAPAAPENRPTTLREGTKAWAASGWGQN